MPAKNQTFFLTGFGVDFSSEWKLQHSWWCYQLPGLSEESCMWNMEVKTTHDWCQTILVINTFYRPENNFYHVDKIDLIFKVNMIDVAVINDDCFSMLRCLTCQMMLSTCWMSSVMLPVLLLKLAMIVNSPTMSVLQRQSCISETRSGIWCETLINHCSAINKLTLNYEIYILYH